MQSIGKMKQKESVFGSHKIPLDETIDTLTNCSDLLKGDMATDVAIAIRDKELKSVFDLTEQDFRLILIKSMNICCHCNISSHMFRAVFELDDLIHQEYSRLNRLKDSILRGEKGRGG